MLINNNIMGSGMVSEISEGRGSRPLPTVPLQRLYII